MRRSRRATGVEAGPGWLRRLLEVSRHTGRRRAGTGAIGTGRLGALVPFRAAADGGMVISAIYADGYLSGEADEALQLWNVGVDGVDLAGWWVGDGPGRATFPAGALLAGGAAWWLARDGEAFRRVFGHAADWSWGGAAGRVGRLATIGGGPALANGGDVVRLGRPDGAVVDLVAYGSGRPGPAEAWRGPATRPYQAGRVAATHQVLYRKLAPFDGRPFLDTDAAGDWASDPADAREGRRVRFPGWDLEARPVPERVREAGRWEVAVAPDALRGFLLRHLAAAQRSVDLVAYTFEQPDLAEALAARSRAGVRVRVLVDGAPAGGLDANERWCLATLAAAGAEVYWWADGGEIGRRYRAMHAKLALLDGRWLLLGSENPGLGSAPADDLADGTAGRRGAWLATDVPAIVAWATAILADDLDPERHADLRPFQARDPERGAPAADFLPERLGGGAGYWPIAREPLVVSGRFPAELVAAPENALAPATGLASLLAQAGPGDRVLLQQLDEPLWWGDPEEGPAAANPRVAGLLAAARRGATVRLLLDGYFDDPADPKGNGATVRHLNRVAGGEGLDLAARVGNPTGLGIHNKLALVHLAGEAGSPAAHWSHVGSLNGSEPAHKVNRELAIQVDARPIHDYLAAVFEQDWVLSGLRPLYLPALER